MLRKERKSLIAGSLTAIALLVGVTLATVRAPAASTPATARTARTHATGAATITAASAETYTFAGLARSARVSNFYSSPAILRVVFNTTAAGAAASATFCDEEIVPGCSVEMPEGVVCGDISIYAVGAAVTYQTHFTVAGW